MVINEDEGFKIGFIFVFGVQGSVFNWSLCFKLALSFQRRVLNKE